MGYWGSSLFSNDLTCDVRDSYLQYLENGDLDEDAYQKTLEMLEECTDEEVPLFWYALADTQWRIGRLMPFVEEKALSYLSAEGGLELWEDDPKGGLGWKKTMDRLKEKLSKPQPRRKRIESPAVFQYDPGDVGDVFAYRFHTKEAEMMGYFGKYILMQKIGVRRNGFGWVCPHMIFFDALFDDLPESVHLEEMRILPFDPPGRFMPSGRNESFPDLNMSAVLDLYKRRNSPKKHIFAIGTFPVVRYALMKIDHRSEFGWDDIERTLLTYHSEWKQYSYRSSPLGTVVFKREERC